MLKFIIASLIIGVIGLTAWTLSRVPAKNSESFNATLAHSSSEDLWKTDYQQAVLDATKSGKPLLLDFTGSDWCGWCIKLKKEVFDQPEFAAWAKDHVVLVEVDFPNGKPQSAAVKAQNEELSKRFDIQGFPTIVILDPTGTKRLGDLGYQEGGPKAWIDAAEKITATAKP